MPKRKSSDESEFESLYRKLKKRLRKDFGSDRNIRSSSSTEDSDDHLDTEDNVLVNSEGNDQIYGTEKQRAISPMKIHADPIGHEACTAQFSNIMYEDSNVPAVETFTAGTSTSNDPLPTEDQPLDSDILEILGVDPRDEIKYGNPIQKDVAIRLEHTATSGLTKDERKELVSKYLLADNCKLINAPILNPEIKAALNSTVIKRDKVIETKQKLLASAIASLGTAISLVLSSKDKNNELLKHLVDAGRIICDCQHNDTITRKTFIINSVKPEMRESLQNTKIDEYMFGYTLPDTLKAAKAITKSGAELKPAPLPKVSYKNSVASSSKNWKSQSNPVSKKPSVNLREMPKSRSTQRAPPPNVPLASSYKPSQSQRVSRGARRR